MNNNSWVQLLPIFVLLSLTLSGTTVASAEKQSSELLNQIEDHCKDDSDCVLTFKTCVRSQCQCATVPANKDWKPKCSNGIVTEEVDPTIACSICYPFSVHCRNGRCERVDLGEH